LSKARPAALEGVRVLDLAGPLGWYATKLFAHFGADVIRIETPGGDSARLRPPFQGGGPEPERSLPFQYFNSSKRSEILDLETAAGRERFKNLAREADVMVETGTPGGFDERGIGYRALRQENPRIVWASITPFGQWGPYAQWKANDLILQAMGGLVQLAGVPESQPTRLAGHQAEYQAGVMAACGVLIALRERDRSGKGQFVDISGQVAISFDSENAMTYWDVDGWVRPRLGIRNYRGVVQMFPASDGWVILSMGNRWKAFKSWVHSLGLLPEDMLDPKWESTQYRSVHAAELEVVCRTLCLNQTKEQLYFAGQEARVGVGPVTTVKELYEDPQLLARDFWTRVETRDNHQEIKFPGSPFKMSRTPGRISTAAPALGTNNGEGWKPRVERPVTPKPGVHALEGVRVVDMSWVAAGPFGTRILADHGAQVMKIETSLHQDSTRALPSPRPAGNSSPNVSGMWNNVNTSKASVVLDLRQPEAVQLLERLIATADVLVDNFGVDPYPRWGLTSERLQQLNPDLIVARSSVMGRSGPRAHFIGMGYTISAAAGHNSISGMPNDPPVGAGIAHPDYTSNPYHLAFAILTALHYRDRTGEGQWIDLAQHESTVSWIGPELLDYSANGVIATQNGNRDKTVAPHGVFPALGEEKWIAIACENDAEFDALCEVLGAGFDSSDPRFAGNAARKTNEDELEREIARMTRTWESLRLTERLQKAGVAAGPVLSHRELLEYDPQMQHRGHYRQIEHAEAGLRRFDSPPVLLGRTPGGILRPAPLLGEDTEWAARDLLGLSEDEIASGYVDGWFQ
jgi:crotonobetainyl-CoA:carnitine CoA-transferase CaiB-like acyl-CoA transferase